ncbi:MAG: hypothetical protein U0871_11525 [Gemmataceae bacterium]
MPGSTRFTSTLVNRTEPGRLPLKVVEFTFPKSRLQVSSIGGVTKVGPYPVSRAGSWCQVHFWRMHGTVIPYPCSTA